MSSDGNRRVEDAKRYMTKRNTSVKIGAEYQAVIPDLVGAPSTVSQKSKDEEGADALISALLKQEQNGMNTDLLLECLQEVVNTRKSNDEHIQEEKAIKREHDDDELTDSGKLPSKTAKTSKINDESV